MLPVTHSNGSSPGLNEVQIGVVILRITAKVSLINMEE